MTVDAQGYFLNDHEAGPANPKHSKKQTKGIHAEKFINRLNDFMSAQTESNKKLEERFDRLEMTVKTNTSPR